MISTSLERLINAGPLLSVSCRWCEYDDEDMRRAVAAGEWQVWAKTADLEEWLASCETEAEAEAFAGRARAYFRLSIEGTV